MGGGKNKKEQDDDRKHHAACGKQFKFVRFNGVDERHDTSFSNKVITVFEY